MARAESIDDRDPAAALEAEVTAICVGPPDEFVARRAALAKELRAAGRREEARDVKALRKPKRLAWALDVAAAAAPSAVSALASAVADTIDAQAGGGDLRASLAALREAVSDLAATASRLAGDMGQPVETADLADAVMAVLGSREAFDLMRASRLVDIPEAGGLELLAGPAAVAAADRVASVTPGAKPVQPDSAGPEEARPAQPDPAAIAAMRDAERALTAARERLAAAEGAMGEAEAAAESAEERLAAARTEAVRRREDAAAARGETDAATAAVEQAEAALERARAAAGVDA